MRRPTRARSCCSAIPSPTATARPSTAMTAGRTIWPSGWSMAAARRWPCSTRAFRAPRCCRDRMGVNALARFERDVLSQPHADTVVLMMGINDIGWPGCGLALHDPEPTADDIIAGYRQLIAARPCRRHAHHRRDADAVRRCLRRLALRGLLHAGEGEDPARRQRVHPQQRRVRRRHRLRQGGGRSGQARLHQGRVRQGRPSASECGRLCGDGGGDRSQAAGGAE